MIAIVTAKNGKLDTFGAGIIQSIRKRPALAVLHRLAMPERKRGKRRKFTEKWKPQKRFHHGAYPIREAGLRPCTANVPLISQSPSSLARHMICGAPL